MKPRDWPKHTHVTRDIKPRGECPGCDHDVWEPADQRAEDADKAIECIEPEPRLQPDEPPRVWVARGDVLVLEDPPLQ